MTHLSRVSVAACALLAGSSLAQPLARATISGFGDYTSQWNFQQLDSAPSFSPSGNGVRLTTSTGGNQFRNYYHKAQQGISQFVASFTYQAGTATSDDVGTGLSLVLFTSGTAANGTPSGGNIGSWGITNTPAPSGQNSLNPSVELVLGLPTPNFPAISGAGFYTNARVGGSLPPTGTVNLGINHPIDVRVRYNQPGDLGNFLYLTLTDQVSGAVYAPAPTALSIQSVLGSSSAFVGFSTHAQGSEQIITNFSFTAIPTPASASLLGIAGSATFRRRRR